MSDRLNILLTLSRVATSITYIPKNYVEMDWIYCNSYTTLWFCLKIQLCVIT